MKKSFNLINTGNGIGALPNILLLIGASISIVWAAYFAIVTISIPYQIELREGAALVLTKLMLSRQNPFILENQPLAINLYGVGYNLVVLPFASLFGNTLWVHRLVTFIFVLLSSVACFSVIYPVKRNLSLSLACGAFVMIGLMARGGIGAFPSAMGAFLFLMTLFLPFRKSFNTTSLVYGVFFALASFYTKPYFVLGFGILASYLFLFVSKKKGAFYSLFFIAVFLVSFFVMCFFFPLYFTNTLAGNASNASTYLDHLLAQLKQLWLYFYPVLIASLFLVGINYRKTGAESPSSNGGGRIINVSSWDHPLVTVSPGYFVYIFACSLLVFLFILGPNIGSYLTYAYQILIPSFFCWFFQRLDLSKRGGPVYALLVLFNLFSWEGTVLHPRMLEQKNSANWVELYSYIQPSSNVLNSPVITSRVVELQLNPLDSGQTAYFYTLKPFSTNTLIGPSYDTMDVDGFKYIKYIDGSIEGKKFDLIFTNKGTAQFYHSRLISSHYSLVRELVVEMPQIDQQWTVQIWKPLEE